MGNIFADRITDVPKSFIREILKVAADSSYISFAGGLPNRDYFPVKELKEASIKVFDKDGKDALQYSNTEGYIKLREFISQRYKEKQGLDIPVDNILITNGSQQGLDLIGKTFINDGDDIIIEEPGYLGAIQAFSVYRANFNPVPLLEDGIDTDALKSILDKKNPKVFYAVPNFQNPSGITYSEEKRIKVSELLKGKDTFFIEDDPYGEFRYTGTNKSSFKKFIPGNTIMLGTFSKIVVPSFRLGWIVAPDHIIERLIVAKQASDLHTNYFSQRVISQYLEDYSLDDHIKIVKNVYEKQRQAMLGAMEKNFPDYIKYTRPEGGMFLWCTLPESYSSSALIDIALKEKVAFVPGDSFYVNKRDVSTFRMNFSSVDEPTIEVGIKRLADSIRTFCK